MITWREIENRGSSKTKHAEVRAKLAADVEAFMAKGGEIITPVANASDEIVDTEFFRRAAKISKKRLSSGIATKQIMGIAMPTIHSYKIRSSKVKDIYFKKSDVLRFAEMLELSRKETAA